MKVPDIFKPEKDLEKKTESLLQEKKNIPNFKPTEAVQKELEEILNSFDKYFNYKGEPSGIVHRKINNLITKSDYKPFKVKGCYWEYWIKPSIQNFDESHVLIRSSDKHEWKHYAFARVDNLRLENFCRLFEKYETGVISGINHNKPYFQIGMITGTLGGAVPFFVNPALIYTVASLIPMIGFIGGAFGGTYLARCMHSKYGKKLIKHYEELETFSLHAIKKAFEAK